jgi:2-polyprenyl-3-methyl-5-hydroxy-6-metoxy-1,4-benzoquinol methylase
MIELPPLDARIPAWDFEDLCERACPVCGGSGAAPRFVRPDRLVVRRCDGCTTYFVSPAPSAAQLDAFYARYDEQHRRDPPMSVAELRRAYLRSPANADFRLRELASLRPLAGAQVLDVGFGRARMLFDAMRLGAVPHGVELDEQAIAIARALGITRVTRGTLDDLPADALYDAILLCDLIEHPLAPLDVLAAAARRLAPGGHLLVWTPNGSAADREPAPTTFRVDLEHMQYFTPRSLGRAAGETGLVVVHLETVGFPDLAGIDRPRDRGPAPGARFRERLRALPGFAALNRMRRGLLAGSLPDERDGVYGLFALLEKPGGGNRNGAGPRS